MVLRLALILFGLVLFSADAVTSVAPSSIAFRIFRDGQPIGLHVTQIRQDGRKLVVETKIDVDVRFAFMSLYTYHHRNREEWISDRLVRFVSETDDNGETYSVDGRATPAGFEVRAGAMRYVVTTAVRPASFWDRRILQAATLIDTKTGALLDVSVRRGKAEPLATPLGPIQARRYSVSGDLAMDLWFASTGPLAKLRMRARADGSTIEYRPIDPATSPDGKRDPATSPVGKRDPATSPVGKRDPATSPDGTQDPATPPDRD